MPTRVYGPTLGGTYSRTLGLQAPIKSSRSGRPLPKRHDRDPLDRVSSVEARFQGQIQTAYFPGLGPRGDRPFTATLGAVSWLSCGPGRVPGRLANYSFPPSPELENAPVSPVCLPLQDLGCHDLHDPNSSASATFQTRSRRRMSSGLGPEQRKLLLSGQCPCPPTRLRHLDSGPQAGHPNVAALGAA